jgi:WD40 repeat protein
MLGKFNMTVNILMLFSTLTGCYGTKVPMHSTRVEGLGVVDWASCNDDASLIAFGYVRSILLYDVKTQKIHTIWDSRIWGSDTHGESVAFHPINANLIACCDQGSVGLVDWKAKKTLFRLQLEPVLGFLPGVSFSDDGSCLFVIHSFYGNSNNTPKEWDEEKQGVFCVSEILKIDIESQKIVDKIFLCNEIVNKGVDFDLAHRRFAVRTMGGKAEIRDLESGHCIQSVKHWNGDSCVKFIDDNTLITDGFPNKTEHGYIKGNVVCWNIEIGKPSKIFNLHSMALTRNGLGILLDKEGNKYVLSGGQDRRAILWNLDTGKIVWSKRFGFDVRVATSANGKVAVICADGDPMIVTFDF